MVVGLLIRLLSEVAVIIGHLRTAADYTDTGGGGATRA